MHPLLCVDTKPNTKKNTFLEQIGTKQYYAPII